MMDPWSSGYDVSLTRRRSPVRLRVGPLLLLVAFLTGCTAQPSATITATLGDEQIQSGKNTTLTVTATNQGNKPVEGMMTTRSDGDQIRVTHPNPLLLDTTLYPGERITRVFTVTATTSTRRTDYAIHASFDGDDHNATTTTILTVTQS